MTDGAIVDSGATKQSVRSLAYAGLGFSVQPVWYHSRQQHGNPSLLAGRIFVLTSFAEAWQAPEGLRKD